MTKIQVRRGTAAQWTSANSILSAGEWGFETDTKKFKIGDGTTAWTTLGYAASGANSPFSGALTFGGNLAAVQTGSSTTVTTFNGTTATTVDLPSTISVDVDGDITGNAETASKLETQRKINGTNFDGSADVVVGAAIFGKDAPNASTTTFTRVYVSSVSAGEPASPNNGDVWISW
jgi:hypothetical protein